MKRRGYVGRNVSLQNNVAIYEMRGYRGSHPKAVAATIDPGPKP